MNKSKIQSCPQGSHDTPTVAQFADVWQQTNRKNTRDVSHALLVHLEAFAGPDVRLTDVDANFCRQFALFLAGRVRSNSARTYLQSLHAVLSHAAAVGLIADNPMPPYSTLLPRVVVSPRASLTTDEVHLLAAAPCPHDSTRRAFLFACYTGLRLSDIETLTWDNIQNIDGRFLVNKVQVKTGHAVCVPLCDDAVDILSHSPHDDPDRRVLPTMCRTVIATDLNTWAQAAGLRKHLSFHVSRHTFATLALEAGIDIMVISKLCGHVNVKTTQNYLHFRESILMNDIKKLNSLLTAPTNSSKNFNNQKKTPYVFYTTGYQY